MITFLAQSDMKVQFSFRLTSSLQKLIPIKFFMKSAQTIIVISAISARKSMAKLFSVSYKTGQTMYYTTQNNTTKSDCGRNLSMKPNIIVKSLVEGFKYKSKPSGKPNRDSFIKYKIPT